MIQDYTSSNEHLIFKIIQHVKNLFYLFKMKNLRTFHHILVKELKEIIDFETKNISNVPTTTNDENIYYEKMP